MNYFRTPVQKGFTLIETLLAIGTLLIFFTAIFSIVQTILYSLGQSRVRSTALMLAQSQMEQIRNLPYTMVGTVGGIPSGSIPQSTIQTINGQEFTISTSVIYVDDPYDGEAPVDIINTDYKRVRVEVRWGGAYASTYPLTLISNLVPKGIETVIGGGTIMVQITNTQGGAVNGATVTFDNTSVTPQIHMSTLSNNNGIVVLPGAPACNTCYKITVTKSGYSSDRTYDTTEVANPLQPYATVIEGEVTQRTFSIDTTGTLNFTSYGSKASGYPLISGVGFTLTGSRLIGYTTTDDPVHKFTTQYITSGGYIQIPGLESDSYTVDMNSSLYMLAGTSPPMPLSLTPGGYIPVSLVAVPKSNVSYLITVKNTTGTLQASAAALLVSSSPISTISAVTAATGSADFGQAFFGSLTPGIYALTVSLPGYLEATSSITLTTNQSDTIVLTPIQ